MTELRNIFISGEQNNERHVWVSPVSSLTTNIAVRLVGTSFDGTAKDASFWTETVTNGGSITQSGGIVLSTSTAANGTAKYESNKIARFIVGAPNRFLGFGEIGTDAVADNVRRFGPYDTNNGYFFQLNGTTFGIGTRKSTSDTIVNTGSFNGHYGASFTLDVSTQYKFEIEYGEFGVFFYINDILLHSIGGNLVTSLSVPVTIENNNTGSTTDSTIHIGGAAILRQGELKSSPYSYFFASGTTAGTQLKIGPGAIHTLVFGSAANNSVVTLSDSTSAATPVLWSYLASGALAVPLSVDFGGMVFDNGLRLTVSAGDASCTIVYE